MAMEKAVVMEADEAIQMQAWAETTDQGTTAMAVEEVVVVVVEDIPVPATMGEAMADTDNDPTR